MTEKPVLWRVPIGAKDRKGVEIYTGDTVRFADVREWGGDDTPEWKIELAGGKVAHYGDASDLPNYCEVTQSEGVDPAAEIARLQAENAALRARAVPAIVWDGEHGKAGRFVFTANGSRWLAGFVVDKKFYWIEEGRGDKSACEAAFLRLVGVQQ